MGYIGMCRSEGYGFQAVYSRIGYINQKVWSRIGYSRTSQYRHLSNPDISLLWTVCNVLTKVSYQK